MEVSGTSQQRTSSCLPMVPACIGVLIVTFATFETKTPCAGEDTRHEHASSEDPVSTGPFRASVQHEEAVRMARVSPITLPLLHCSILHRLWSIERARCWPAACMSLPSFATHSKQVRFCAHGMYPLLLMRLANIPGGADE